MSCLDDQPYFKACITLDPGLISNAAEIAQDKYNLPIPFLMIMSEAFIKFNCPVAYAIDIKVPYDQFVANTVKR